MSPKFLLLVSIVYDIAMQTDISRAPRFRGRKLDHAADGYCQIQEPMLRAAEGQGQARNMDKLVDVVADGWTCCRA